MGLKEYFFDSYALIEIIKGNPQYINYIECAVTITELNLIEVVYSVFKDFGEAKAKEIYGLFSECVQEIDWEIMLEALKFRQKHKKMHLSYADCVGYAFAKGKGFRFLTGDEDFRFMDNVEFVK